MKCEINSYILMKLENIHRVVPFSNKGDHPEILLSQCVLISFKKY